MVLVTSPGEPVPTVTVSGVIETSDQPAGIPVSVSVHWAGASTQLRIPTT
jgi:hypothetical protein